MCALHQHRLRGPRHPASRAAETTKKRAMVCRASFAFIWSSRHSEAASMRRRIGGLPKPGHKLGNPQLKRIFRELVREPIFAKCSWSTFRNRYPRP